MADQKATDLAALTGANAADGDLVTVVDVSDTSMAGTGTNKKMTLVELGEGLGDSRIVTDQLTNNASAPAAGVRLFGVRRGRVRPVFVGPEGNVIEQGPHFGSTMGAWFRPVGNAVTVESPGIVITAIGTATGANWANTNRFTQHRRLSYVSAAGAGSSGGWREAVAKYNIGSSGLGGFDIWMRFGLLTLPAGYRVFNGLHSSTSVIGNVDPSSLTQMLGFGKDTADTLISFMANDGSGTATKTTTGLSALATSDVLEGRIYAAPGATTVYWAVRNITTAPTTWFQGNVSSDLPTSGTGLCIHNWCNNNATASAIDPHWMNYYIEQE